MGLEISCLPRFVIFEFGQRFRNVPAPVGQVYLKYLINLCMRVSGRRIKSVIFYTIQAEIVKSLTM